jgi:hypothetical protein
MARSRIESSLSTSKIGALSVLVGGAIEDSVPAIGRDKKTATISQNPISPDQSKQDQSKDNLNSKNNHMKGN